MKYIKPYGNFVAEDAVTRITTDEVIPSKNKAAATEEPVELETEAQDENEDARTTKK